MRKTRIKFYHFQIWDLVFRQFVFSALGNEDENLWNVFCDVMRKCCLYLTVLIQYLKFRCLVACQEAIIINNQLMCYHQFSWAWQKKRIKLIFGKLRNVFMTRLTVSLKIHCLRTLFPHPTSGLCIFFASVEKKENFPYFQSSSLGVRKAEKRKR